MKKVIISILGLFALSSCEDTYLDPSSASEQQVVSSQNGLIAMINGLQAKYTLTRAGAVYAVVTADGLITKSLRVLNAGNTTEVELEAGGGALLNSNAMVNSLWNQCHLVKSNADLVIKNIDNAPDPAVRSGILSAAHLYRGLALGTLATFWESAPIQVTLNAPFASRQEVLQEAIRTLEAGVAAYAAQAPSASFTTKVNSTVDILNSSYALIARYNLMLGNNDAAIAAADRVSLTAKSGFGYNDNAQNPLFFSTFGNTNVTDLLGNFGLPGGLTTPVADGRRAFYYNTTAGQNSARASFFTSNSSAIPVFLPGEMILIKAEAQARKGAVPAAVTELNKVLTKATDSWGIGAGGEAYSGAQTADAVLAEIFKQRQIELLFSGQRLEDSRRFNRPVSERTRNWFPYPLFERNNNSATPADPAL